MTKKKQPRAKEPVRMRFKALANGNRSIYFDIYQDGRRRYYFPKLYLVEEATPADREANRRTMALASAMKARLVLDISAERSGVRPRASAAPLSAWLATFLEHQLRRGRSCGMLKSLRLLLGAYGHDAPLSRIDADYCRGLIGWMELDYRKRDGRALSPTTRHSYLMHLSAAFNEAVRRGLMNVNPLTRLQPGEKPKGRFKERDFLTAEELRRLEATPCPDDTTRRGYLFACYTGLRGSDVRALRPGHIVTLTGGGRCIDMTMRKTRTRVRVPLGRKALALLGDIPEDDAPLFPLRWPETVRRQLLRWAKAAGIDKHITFHTARHTFATMLLTLGVDLYTVSKLLGHSSVAITQIYAKIIDSKRQEAIDKLDAL